jgi:hypothetical protein
VQPSSYSPGGGRPDDYNSDPYGRSESRWDGSGYPAEPVTVRRTRSWAVALAAAVTALILMAAIGNTSVTDTLNRNARGNSFKDGVLLSLTTVQWRFGAASGDHSRIWLGQLLGDLAAIVLIFLLVWIVANGRGSFWQAFFGAWACAVGALMVATYVNTAVVNTSGSNASKAVVVFFAQNSATSTFALFGALVYGFVIALVAGLVAMATSTRTEMVDASAAPAPSSGYYPSPQDQRESAGYPPGPGPAASSAPWSGSRPDGDHPTEALPRTEDQDRSPHQTAVLPPVGGSQQQGSGPAGPPYGTSSGQYGSPYGGTGSTDWSTRSEETSGAPSSSEPTADEGPPTEAMSAGPDATPSGADDSSASETGGGTPSTQSGTDSEEGSPGEQWPPPPRRDT